LIFKDTLCSRTARMRIKRTLYLMKYIREEVMLPAYCYILVAMRWD